MRRRRVKAAVAGIAAFVLGCGLQWLIVSDAAHAAPAPCKWRVMRERVMTSGGNLAFLTSGEAEPFAAAFIGPTAGGEQWAVLTRSCER